MVKTALITLGRFPKALTLARALKLAGWRVIVADPFRWHLCGVSRDVDRSVRVPSPNRDPDAFHEALLALIASEGVTRVIPVSEEIHHVLPLKALTDAEVAVLGPSPDVYRDLHDKLRFQRRATALGLSSPTTYSALDTAAGPLAATHPVVCKPRDGCSGQQVVRVERGGLSRTLAGMDAMQHSRLLVQAQVEGEELSSLSYLAEGELQANVLYRGRVRSGSVSVCFERVAMPIAVESWIQRFCADLTYTGFLGFDFIVDAEGIPWPLECNPRVTSGIHFFDPAELGALLTFSGEQGLSTPACGFAPETRWQWGYSTLTEAYGFLFKGDFQGFRQTLAELPRARDVVWQGRDPLPFLLMTPLSAEILYPAITEGISLGEASQRDIAPLWDSRVKPHALGAAHAD